MQLENANVSPETLTCSGAPTLKLGGPANTVSIGATSTESAYGCFSSYTWPGGEAIFMVTIPSPGGDLRVILDQSSIPTGKDPDLFLLGSCNASNCYGYGNNTMVVNDLPAGTYYLVVDDYNGAVSYSCTLTAYVATGTLLVDEGNSTPLQAAYVNALTATGYAPTVHDVLASGDPTAIELLGYKRVVWYTGGSTASPLLTANQLAVMQGYLDGGGELMLISQAYLHDITTYMDVKLAEDSFAYQYLQVSAVTNSASVTPLNGVNGDPIGDDGNILTPTTALTLSSSSPTTASPASMDTMFGQAGFTNLSGKAGLIWYDNGLVGDSFKVVFSSYPLENITPASDFQLVLGRSMAFMDNYDYFHTAVATGAFFIDGSISNGIPDPGETIGIQFVAQNNDSSVHTAQAYLVINDPQLSPHSITGDLGSIAATGCMPDPSCHQGSVTFNIDVSAVCPAGHKAEFTVNCWLDGKWYSGPTFGLWMGQGKVFLVKDEQLFPNTSPALIPYEEALNATATSYPYAEWDTAFFGSPWYNDTDYMSNTNMISYGRVVWATGSDWAHTLLPYTASTQPADPADERELQLLLRGGGRLLLCSQDYFYDYFGGASCDPSCTVSGTRPFPLYDLGVNTVNQDVYTGDVDVTGQAGEDVVSGMTGITVQSERDINGLTSPKNACDEVVAKGSSPNPTPRNLFRYQDGQPGATIFEGAVNGGSATARLVSLLFPYENMVAGPDFNSPPLLMKRILYWFDFGDTKSSTYSYPADTTLTWGTIPTGTGWSWTAVTTNRGGQAIPTHYHMYRATSPTGLVKDSLEYTRNYLQDSTTPSPWEVFYYKVRVSDILEIEGPDLP